MAHYQQHVQEFSPDGKLYAFINDQGILCIWDTETNELKQEFTPNFHLSCTCSALIWIAVKEETKPKSAKKSRKSVELELATPEALYIVLGTSNGQVSLYSYAEGNIQRQLNGEGHTGKITAMVHDNGELLYTCGHDCQVIAWSLPLRRRVAAWSIGNDKPSCLAYLPLSQNLVVGTRQLSVYSVATQELLQTFTGHMSEIDLIQAFSESTNEYIVTSSSMERVISLWKIGKKRRNKPAHCTFLTEDIAINFSCLVDEESAQIHLASVTRSGVIHIYLANATNLKTEKPIKPKLTISIASDSTSVVEPIPALAVSFQHANRAKDILMVYGDTRVMLFEQVTPNFEEKMQVLIRTQPKMLYAAKNANKNKNDVALKTLTPQVNEAEVEYQTGIIKSKKQQKTSELPMEKRLENLNITNADAASTAPKAQSKVQLLIQALHSQDQVLLRSVLHTNDIDTIRITMKRLPVQYISPLINELTVLMHQKHENVECALKWLQTLTITHASQLLALGEDELFDKFGPCIGIIEHRANSLKEIAKLSGRLNLLVGQLTRNMGDDEEELDTENVIVYEDTDVSSNSEIEDDEDEKIDESKGEWEEDDNDDEGVEDDDMNDEKMET